MTNTTQITISGGFHNAAPLTLRLTGESISQGQYKRLDRHMCGIKGCICGWRGFDVAGIDRNVFLRMLEEAAYESSRK